MGNAASSPAAGEDSVGGSSDSNPSYSFNDPASSGQGAVAYVPFMDSSAISENPAATGVSGNRGAAAAGGPVAEWAGRRLFRRGPISAGSSSSLTLAPSSSARRLPAVSDGTGIIDGDRHSSAISIDSSPTSSGRSSSSSNRVDSSSSSSNSSSEGSAVGNLVAMTGSGLSGYLRWRFSGVGRGRQSFPSRTAAAAGVRGPGDHTAPHHLISSWTEGEGARAAVPVEREARDGFPGGVSSNVARITPATAAVISGENERRHVFFVLFERVSRFSKVAYTCLTPGDSRQHHYGVFFCIGQTIR